MEKTLLDYLSEVPDFRQENKNFRHSLLDILFLSICATFSGAEDFEDIALYGEDKLEFLQTFLPFTHGIPSHDTIRRVFMHLDSEAFEKQFMAWIQASISEVGLSGKQISIDGKTLRGSKKGIHLVSAVVSELGLSLGQVKTDAKSNEITAIPTLLDMLDLQGCIVSIDAIGTQHSIADKILEKGGDYFLALKGNQGDLFAQVQDQFARKGASEIYQVSDWAASHNQVVDYEVAVSQDFSWVDNAPRWSKLNSLVKVTTQSPLREKEMRYYISSLDNLSGAKAYELARGHWRIENQLHWQLDVTFKEDQQRHRTGNAPQNLALIRKIVLNSAHMYQKGLSKKKILKKMAWNEQYCLEMIKKVLQL